jgi:hypothetical protein
MPRLIPVPLRDLLYGEEFVTSLTRQRGSVVDTGHVLWEDRTGRATRVRAVHVRFASGAERVLRGETPVLVDADRKHARFDPAMDERRWEKLLVEPGSMGTIGDAMKARG